MMKGLVSVIIPTYNRIKLLPRSVKSVLDQTYPTIELIIVDDGSNDGTKEWVCSIQDERVKYLRSDHLGACAARNRGIEAACGEYIAFQDSDDVWYEEKLEKQLEYLTEIEADVVCSAFMYSGADGINPIVWPDPEKQGCRVTVDEISRRNLVSTQTMLGKSEVFKETCFDPQMPRLQDWECAIRLAAKYRVFYDSRVFVHVYEQPDSISSKPELAVSAAQLFFSKHYESQMPRNARAFQEYWKMADNQLIIYCEQQRQIIENQRNELVQVYSDKGILKDQFDQVSNCAEQLQAELDYAKKKPIRWFIRRIILKKA